MHGIPVLLKDNIDATPHGELRRLARARATTSRRRDAFLVQRLRAAGAVILGKTNLSEWANFRSTRSTSGWSGRGGQTKNPYVLDRNPCGSSSGTGTAIAANLAVVGVGTETDGSIICPASVAGLVGLKPTVGLVSRERHHSDFSSSQDTAGPMTRSVSDAAAMLAAMVGRDDADVATANSVGKAVFDYPARLDANALQGRAHRHPAQGNGLASGCRRGDGARGRHAEVGGREVVDAEIPTKGQWDEPEFEVLLYEFKAGLEHYLATHDAPRENAWRSSSNTTRRTPRRRCPGSGRSCSRRRMRRGRSANRRTWMRARRRNAWRGRKASMPRSRSQQLDVLIAPAMSPAWPTDLVLGDHFVGAGYGAAAVAGYPSLTVPMGDSQGLADRRGVRRAGVERSEVVVDRLRVRAAQQVAARAAVPAYGDVGRRRCRRRRRARCRCGRRRRRRTSTATPPAAASTKK